MKKSGKTLIFSFILGLLLFFGLIFFSQYITKLIPIERKPVIGIVGSYRQDNLPPVVYSKLSRGLTKLNSDYSIEPDLAENWEIKDLGKTYVFNLKKDLTYNDKKKITSANISYNFSDVVMEKPEDYVIVFKLKDAYSPFLATASQPIYGKSFSGAGDYNLSDIVLNGDFVQSITLAAKNNRFDTIKYLFYPTEDALKNAYLMGEITQAEGLTNINVKNTQFDNFPGTSVIKETDHTKLVTLFYDNNDKILSDKKVRLGLGYALPEKFSGGESANVPYPPTSIYFNKDIEKRSLDYDHAKLLLPEPPINLTITTLSKYTEIAKEVAKSWEKVGISTTIEEVDSVPARFQIFLGDFTIPKDPDQYSLWHSAQSNNISKYRNLRIDKLLEDGRKVSSVPERQKIYADFQRYLLEDAPAAFLYYPYKYKITRN